MRIFLRDFSVVCNGDSFFPTADSLDNQQFVYSVSCLVDIVAASGFSWSTVAGDILLCVDGAFILVKLMLGIGTSDLQSLHMLSFTEI